MNRLIVAGVIAAIAILIIFVLAYNVSKSSAAASQTMPPRGPQVGAPVSAPTYVPTLDWRCRSLNNNGQWAPIIRNADGNIQCMSTDAANCFWFNNQADCNAKITQMVGSADIKPLVCGDMTQKVWGVKGTDDPNHWCYAQRTDI